ncbi:alpha/beta hydrolase [Thiotrichales bacterium 19S3-7]|nr:alpha/beta hydrolase [Thiotrichales bacterium 19S3-7]MCF6802722.1 alpha/beta hydrolase [Thiotrichales bacterium 19S3-11]
MPFIQVNDLNLYYEQYGSGDDLLLISGLSADHNAWAAVVPELSKHYKVTIFDNRGVGQSSVPEGPYSINMMVEDTKAIMDQLKIESAYVIGHSMGGMIAEMLAIDYPEKVKALVIVCSAAKRNPRSNQWLELSAKMIETETDIPIIADYTFSYLFGSDFIAKPENALMWLDLILSNPYPQTLTGYKNQLVATQTYNALDSLHKIRVKTLIIAGEDDILTPLSASKAIHQVISQSQLLTLPCGHMPTIECPDKLANEIINWLN